MRDAAEIDRRTAELRERFLLGEVDEAEVDRELKRLAFDRAAVTADAEAAAARPPSGRAPLADAVDGWADVLRALVVGVEAGVRAFRAAAAGGG